MVDQLCRALCEDFGFLAGYGLGPHGEWLGSWPKTSPVLVEIQRQLAQGPTQAVRFFRLSQPPTHLALLSLDPAAQDEQLAYFAFSYPDTAWLQNLLKSRVLPMYLQFWIREHQAEKRLAARQKESEPLLAALAEKRAYARQLEQRVDQMDAMLLRLRQSELGLDQQVARLEELLREQSAAFHQLAQASQQQYEACEQSEREHIHQTVALESRLRQLALENARLRQQSGNKPRIKLSANELIQLKMEARRGREEMPTGKEPGEDGPPSGGNAN
jgi:hypothetical protein